MVCKLALYVFFPRNVSSFFLPSMSARINRSTDDGALHAASRSNRRALYSRSHIEDFLRDVFGLLNLRLRPRLPSTA